MPRKKVKINKTEQKALLIALATIIILALVLVFVFGRNVQEFLGDTIDWILKTLLFLVLVFVLVQFFPSIKKIGLGK